MIKEFLEIGEIVSTHGIKGEVRLNPWCDGPEFVKKFKKYFTNEFYCVKIHLAVFIGSEFYGRSKKSGTCK